MKKVQFTNVFFLFLLINGFSQNPTQEWVEFYSSTTTLQATAVFVDLQDNVYIAGSEWSSSGGMNFLIIKYDPNGQLLWIANYDGPSSATDNATSIFVNNLTGDVYVTGASTGSGTDMDYATIKYNSFGEQQWVARYNGPGNGYDKPESIAIDGNGNVVVTGSSAGSGTGLDYATIMYNSNGTQQWVARYL